MWRNQSKDRLGVSLDSKRRRGQQIWLLGQEWRSLRTKCQLWSNKSQGHKVRTDHLKEWGFLGQGRQILVKIN